jgi:hypothetical protein
VANISRLIQSYPDRLRKQMAANAKEAADFLEQKLKDRLNRPYPPASKPGQAPATRSHRLRDETYCKPEIVGDTVVITMASPTPYAEFLAKSGRVWITTVKEENRAQVEEILLRKGFNNLERWARG